MELLGKVTLSAEAYLKSLKDTDLTPALSTPEAASLFTDT